MIIEKVCGRIAPIAIEDLKSRLPTVAHNGSADSATTPAMRELLHRLELSTGGVIRLETDAARFDPEAAGAPELAAFNTALMLARRFDARLALAHNRVELTLASRSSTPRWRSRSKRQSARARCSRRL